MGDARIRRTQLLRLAQDRGYSVPPRYLCWHGQWYDVRSGNAIKGTPSDYDRDYHNRSWNMGPSGYLATHL
jgi:hypothetical protein